MSSYSSMEKTTLIASGPVSCERAQMREYLTTQKSYYAMERGAADKQLRDAWKEHPIASSIKHEKAVIDQIRDLPGYG